MGNIFFYGDKVKVIGKDNPFFGEEGMFWGYKNRGLEVHIFSMSGVYWFDKDEIEKDGG